MLVSVNKYHNVNCNNIGQTCTPNQRAKTYVSDMIICK